MNSPLDRSRHLNFDRAPNPAHQFPRPNSPGGRPDSASSIIAWVVTVPCNSTVCCYNFQARIIDGFFSFAKMSPFPDMCALHNSIQLEFEMIG
jgi:hypothetical protein